MISQVVAAGVTAACAGGIAFIYQDKLYAVAKKVVKWAAIRVFYVGFRSLNPKIAEERRNTLLSYQGARDLQCTNPDGTKIDALYIPSQKSSLKVNSVLILCLNTTYQDHHSRHWEPFLNNGADIILWNPTKLGPIAYSNDLSSILRYLRERDPDQVIAIKTYCASTDPGIRSVADQKDSKMHIILDRGYGDVQKLARSFTVFANLPMVRDVLKEDFDCEGITKIKQISGKLLFLIPTKLDQVMDYGRACNLTRDLSKEKPRAHIIDSQLQDHWSSWDFNTYNEVLEFLADIGVVNRSYQKVKKEDFPLPQPLICFRSTCVPLLIKACL